MTISQIAMLAAMSIYLLAMVGIGIKLSNKNETVNDFYLGGRQLGPLVTAMSAEASDMSSWLLMGLPGVAYLAGISSAGYTALGLAIGTYVNWLIVAKRLRRYTAINHSITLPQFFSRRYHDKKNILAFVAAIEIVIFFIPYTASGFAACGKLFNSLFGINYHVAMIISAIVIILYTTLGGFLAASTTDLIQSIVMTVALFIILLFGINTVGGIDNVINNAKALPGYLGLASAYDPVTKSSTSISLLSILSNLAWGLGYFGMPHILVRFMAIENENKIALSRRVASIWAFISMAVSIVIGVIGLSMSKYGKIDHLKGSASETVIVKISALLSTHGVLFAVIAGIVLSGILASTMSTSDSQLLAASSAISNDIYVGFFKAKVSDKKLMILSRITLLLIAIIGIFLAWNPNSSVFGIVSFAWAGFGATFGPIVLLALFWRRSNMQGALAGLIVGGIMVFLWKFVISTLGGLFGIYELLPAFVVALLTNILVSFLTTAPSDDVTKEFDSICGK
ncbi:sodium/proline symporter [Lachnobacterium bovis]|uniref:Sodium/proline symporter n=1 Tax=Lachnobacterium bovis DSM 14045 TaxID=1122142 RepID=A0A1H3GED1_9FIRM|nr:sodium/proline symporter [Lachnobacterium bovis]SDY01683.1 sodium/proline symporter [Lachnobacterium bovis DSM 14045]